MAAASAAQAAVPDTPAGVAQEVTLDGLGIGSQTVYGARGAVEVTFPAAAADIAQAGNFVRVFFSHSVDVTTGSSMLIAVDGQPLLTVPLGPSTAGGGVVEARIPTTLLAPRGPNRLQVRFALDGPAATLYGRIDGETTLHYELAPSSTGLPQLEEYPYSLLAAGATKPALGLVLPASPSARDLAAAFRVLGDLGRRAASQHVRPRVVTTDQGSWLAAGGVSAVLVGTLGALPAAPPVLLGAGWRQIGNAWTAPDGRVLGSDQGLVLAAVSPWDHRTALLLVTGGTPSAVDRAAAALISGGGALAGQYVIVSAASPTEPTGPPRTIHISVLSPRDLASFGAGRYRATVGFTAPAVDAPFTTGGADTATAGLSLPDPLPTAGDLRLLPFPFLEAGRPLQLVLADGTPV